MTEGRADVESVRDALDRVLASRSFRRSVQLSKFLRFTVERTLEGRVDEIKEYTVGVEAYGRPESFDPRADPTIRTEARRLRTKLASYYDHEGISDPLRIELPKGTYVPEFIPVDVPARKTRRHLLSTLGAFGLIGAGVLAWWPRAEPTAVPERPRVAVLPFETSSTDDESVALAMTESLINQLAATDSIVVATRLSSWPATTNAATRQELAGLVGADYTVDGTVTRSDDIYHVATELVRASDDAVVWTRSRDFLWSDVFDAQDELASELSERLVPTATRARNRAPTTRMDAYESYVRGRFSAVQFNNTRQSLFFDEADRRLQSATSLDPELADAWATRGELWVARLYPPAGERDEILATARGFLERALEIDPAHVTALYTLGRVQAQRAGTETGIELCRRAIELEPRDSDAHQAIAAIYGEIGFYEAAQAENEQAIELDPLFLTAYALNARWLAKLGRFEEARSAIEHAMDISPGSLVLDLLLGDVYYRSGQLERAETLWRGRLSDDLGPHEASMFEIALGLIAAERGDETEARRILEEYRGTPYRDLTHLTEIAALLGDVDYVVERVELHPERYYRWLIEEPKFRRFARAPAFETLLRSRHALWLSHLELYSDALAAPPPVLPTPDEYLAQAYSGPADTEDGDSEEGAVWSGVSPTARPSS